MKLRLCELQRIVEQTLNDEEIVSDLREEAGRVLDRSLLNVELEEIATKVNEELDLLEHVDCSTLGLDSNVLIRCLKHSDPNVRRFAARVVPKKYLADVAYDRSKIVRAAVASRAGALQVREMMKKFPNDKVIRSIYVKRRLHEGLPMPKANDEPFDMHGEKLGDVTQTEQKPELSKQWYETKAFKLLQDYGGNIEYAWEEIAVKDFVDHTKATSGVEIDAEKLLDALKKLMEERDDRALERNDIKESHVLLPEYVEPIDLVKELLETNVSSSAFVSRMNSLFNVKESIVPGALRKHIVGEGRSVESNVPVSCRTPHGKAPRALDERALDAYCRAWNAQQSVRGEPFVIEWSNHPDSADKICFSVVLK